ncbi:GxxExxY protein [uncultured Polaribacter sp.]|uniref:GxxExxY protein n=1 Tax=uncultured Polaribacter sp. TaxID=174711 RepID=UPI002610BFF8|nr:GxxExxY protein [uncultured Polaribacter sp.]
MIYKKESYDIVGTLFEVHNNLGGGFLEVVYKDALEYEFEKRNINFEREKEYIINYKDIVLKHHFFADFVIFNKIILEIKSVKKFHPKHIAQCINYLKVSKNKLCILLNF